MTVVCLLRGVNVGGSHKMKMDALRDLFTELGYANPRTLIQSGNIVFEARRLPDSRKLESAIESRFGFHSDVVLRTAEELGETIHGNPFAGREGINPSRLLVTFLSRDPGTEAEASLHALDLAGEEAHLRGRDLYIYFQQGIGKTRLKFPALAKALGESGTARNWNTVLKLVEMAAARDRA
jgi:uncharacterized protein (DUF1697 family)